MYIFPKLFMMLRCDLHRHDNLCYWYYHDQWEYSGSVCAAAIKHKCPLQRLLVRCQGQTCEHRRHRSRGDIEITHPPISEAIPKFTERVIVQLPMSQIQPIVVEMKISKHFSGEPVQFLVLTGDVRKWDFPFLRQLCRPRQQT